MFKHSYEYVYNFFKDQGCELLTLQYTNTNQILSYRCPCGKISTTRFRHMRGGRNRCRDCLNKRAYEKQLQQNGGISRFQTKEFLEKRIQLWREKYGTDNPLQNEQVKEKRKQTNLQRYGVENVSQDPEIRSKQLQGMKDKYGYEYSMQVPESKEKFYDTLMKNHGVRSLAELSNRCSKESQRLFW
jgi:hypothetical protein